MWYKDIYNKKCISKNAKIMHYSTVQMCIRDSLCAASCGLGTGADPASNFGQVRFDFAVWGVKLG